MRFEQITIQNLFCYYGIVTFAGLLPTDPNRNLIIIRGRNNRGKTCFLRSLKLLFAGITRELREEVSVFRLLTDGQYFRGDGVWQGICNRDAVAEKRDRFAVSAQLLEGIDTIEIERAWDRNGDEQLCVTGPHGTLRGELAQSWLEARIPPEVVSYFFFDGELVQRLVNEQRTEAPAAIRKLFGLQPLMDLGEQLGEVVKAWAREAAPEERRRELDELGYRVLAEESVVARLVERLAELGKAIETNAVKLGSVDEQLDRLAARGTEAEFARIETLEKQQADLLKTLSARVLKEEVPWLPLWVSSELVTRVRKRLTTMLEHPTEAVDAQVRVWTEVGSELPAYIIDGPASPFTAPQRQHIRDRIGDFVRRRTPERRTERDWSLSEAEARQVIYSLDQASERQMGTILVERAKAEAELLRVREQKRNFAHLTDDENRKRVHLSSERDGLLVERTRLQSDEGKAKSELQGARQQLSALEGRKAGLEDALEREMRAHANVEVSKGLKDMMPVLADTLVRKRSATISQEMQERFDLLFSSNTQVGRCFLAQDFTIGCEDRAGAALPRGSLSAGTQQILAMSLLWTLMSESDTNLPVVIDTPLARLDEKHREAIVSEYLPFAGDQVFVLPTDAELGDAHLAALAPYIHLHLELKNPTGARSRPERI